MENGTQVVQTTDEKSARSMIPSEWIVGVSAKGVNIIRLHHGRPIESYPMVKHAVAAVYLAAISQGLQPPKCLLACDTPPD